MSNEAEAQQKETKQLSDNLKICGIIENIQVMTSIKKLITSHKNIICVVSFEEKPKYLASLWFNDALPTELSDIQDKFQKIEIEQYKDKLILHQESYEKIIQEKTEKNFINLHNPFASPEEKQNQNQNKAKEVKNSEINITIEDDSNSTAEIKQSLEHTNVIIADFLTFTEIDSQQPVPAEMCLIKVRDGRVIGKIHEIFSISQNNQFNKLKVNTNVIQKQLETGILLRGVKSALGLTKQNIEKVKSRIEDFCTDAEHSVIVSSDQYLGEQIIHSYFGVSQDIKILSVEALQTGAAQKSRNTKSYSHPCGFHSNFDTSVKCAMNRATHLAAAFVKNQK